MLAILNDGEAKLLSRGSVTMSILARNELDELADCNVLVTGADGMLGRAFVEALEPFTERIRIDALSHTELDVTSRKHVLERGAQRPDIILHCAAMVDADLCERAPDVARQVIVGGTDNIAELAHRTGARVFYPQSVFIFDGRELPVSETTQPNPTFVYGQLKLDAERRLLARMPQSLVIRMAGFFGGDDKDKNFVGKFVRQIARVLPDDDHVIDVGDRIWQPTYTIDLANNTLLLIARECHGIYHMGSIGEASFYDVARLVVGELGLRDRLQVRQVSSQAFDEAEPAPRPRRMVTANTRLIAEGLCRQRPWHDALREYLARPYFDRFRHTGDLLNARLRPIA